jgi:hypothetical protein
MNGARSSLKVVDGLVSLAKILFNPEGCAGALSARRLLFAGHSITSSLIVSRKEQP